MWQYVLACLFTDFDIDLGPSQDPKPRPVQDSLTLPMQGGLHVCLRPRAKGKGRAEAEGQVGQ